MAITFYPHAGTVLLCDFKGFKPPEITKLRPVVIVSSHHMHHGELYTIVPLSTTAPRVMRPCHYKFECNPVRHKEDVSVWAKCDIMMTVSRERLDRFKLSRGKYRVYEVTKSDFDAIKSCLKYVLGIT
jgi:uncharacterized protein YifN (PemK superfamily)